MDEAKKTNAIRGPEFIAKYLQGKVIDIGAGPDLVCDWAERFDIEDGDANFMTKYRPVNDYDAVHSSHCLEHMHDPESALLEWWSLLKPGGYLITVVPNEDLYEQGIWPSIFNTDHKSTFRLDTPASWSPRSFDIKKIIANLPGAEIVCANIHDIGYDYSLQRQPGGKPPHLPKVWRIIGFRRIASLRKFFGKSLERLLFKAGVAIDQTGADALAQIQVVARKNF